MRWLSDAALERLRRPTELPEPASRRYRLLEVLGQGGMGVVYLAADSGLERQVALKVLDVPDHSGELERRLLREARVLARLEHPGIVPVHDVGQMADGRLFYVMKLVKGLRLDAHLAEGRSLPERLRLFVRICEAVAFAHARGVLHRDLKPENIMVGPFGEVLVMDWGLAKLLRKDFPGGATDAPTGSTGSRHKRASPASVKDSPPGAAERDRLRMTGHGVVLGTPGYMAPEQARGEIDQVGAGSDVYSLGAVLRYLLDGPISEDATTLSAKGQLTEGAVAPSPATPKALAAIVGRAMAPELNERYASVDELAAEIDRYLDGQPVLAYPESRLTRFGRFLGQHRVAVILVVTYAVVRALVLVLAGR